MAATDNIRVAIRVRPLIKRENDFHQPIHWKVDGNTITQLSNAKILPNSSYFFDRIFDMSSSTQDVYDEFGRPTVLSAMDGFNGTLFAYGQTSSGKTHTMMGDGKYKGVIPKAIGEIFDYIEKNPSREFLIRVSYIEIYNEDIKDLLNPAKTNLKIHENAQKQVYVGDLTEEVVSCSEDVFKHMMRGEKNRHFGVTNMNDRSSRSHTIFRVVIESREMMDESKTPDTIDGAVRVAHLNLVDLAGSERASQTGAFGQRLKEGGHINKSLLALGSVIAKLSEGESFIPFRDSKLTRILQSSLGGNAKTSMLCTITPAAIEESISTLKFASRAKTIKNCPEVNEVLDDGTLLKRYRKEIRELKQQLVEMSSSSHVQELLLEKEKVNEMEEMLEQQRRQQNEQEEKIKRLCNMICTAGGETGNNRSKQKLAKRRETWCPGAGLSKAPLASTVFSSVKSRLQRIPSSPSSDESEFGEMTKDMFLSTLEEEEDIKSSESGKKRVVFASPVGKRCLSSITDVRQQEHKEMQTEPDQNCMEMEREVKRLRSDLHEAIETRDFYNELLEESNALLEKMSTENGRNDTPTAQMSMLKTLDQLRAKNKELQAEFDSVKAGKEALAARVEELENAGTCNTATQMKADSLQMALEESERERNRLHQDLKELQKVCTSLESDVARLQNKIANARQEDIQSEEEKSFCQQEASEKIRQLELQIKEMEERLSGVNEQEGRLTEAIDEKVQLEESKKLEISCLEEALDEMTKEKGQLEQSLQMWKDKCASLETNAALCEKEKFCLEEKMTFAKEEASEKIKKLEEQVKEMVERIASVDEQEGMLTEVIEQKLQLEENHNVEMTSLKTALTNLEESLDEVTKEKGRLEEALQQWKDKCASLETLEARYEEEKLRLEERMAFAGEEASEKIRKLEDQVKKMAERLASVDEREGMLTEVTEQKLQLEENHNVEITSLKTALTGLEESLDEVTKEKGRSEEALQQWKDKCARFETNEARYEEEKLRLEERMAFAGEEASEKIRKLEDQVKEMEERLASVDEQEGMLTEVTEQKLQLEENHSVEITSLKTALTGLEESLDEVTKEKGRLEEALQQWKDKCASLETNAALYEEEKLRLEEGMAFAGEEASEKIRKLEDQVKGMEERLTSVDEQEGMLTEVTEQKSQQVENHEVEITSLKTSLTFLEESLDEVTKEKGRLEEALQQWKDKYAGLETNAALYEEEKLRLEERMVFAEEEASEKIRKLEDQVKEMKERLASVDEQEGMLTEVLEQESQLVESHEQEETSPKMAQGEISEEKESLEPWKERYSTLESDMTGLQNEMACVKMERLEESLSSVKEEASVKMKELEIELETLKGKLSDQDQNKRMLAEVNEQKGNLEEIVARLETELAQRKDLNEDKCNIEARFKQFKEEKEAEIMELKKEIQGLQDQRNISSYGVEEKDKMMEQMIDQKREMEAKMSDLQMQLDNVNNEKEEYEQMLNKVKKEKDEIRNDLSESISDSAELQKDMLDMQQKVKLYKEHIYELESELQQRAELLASHEQKTEELQNQLSEVMKQLENVSQDVNKKLLCEEQALDQQNEKKTDDDMLASKLRAEQERAQEVADECNTLRLSLENVQNRNEILKSEAEETKQEVEKQRQEIESLELQLVESKQAYDLCKEKLEEQREKCEKLVKDLNEMRTSESLSKEPSGSLASELELQKAKNESEELFKELGEEKKAHETLRKEHASLLEELQHFKDSLLRDTNRGMDQQRLIDKMKAERRETICVQAQQRHELENDLSEAEKKVSELEAQCNFLKSERDVLEHRIEAANKKVEETKLEMRDMENLYSSQNVLSVTHRDDDSKVLHKLKQMELNVELTKQKCEKAEGRVKELESENRQLKGADIRNGALVEERDSLKQQVQQSKQVLNEKNKKVNELSIEVTQLKAHVDKLTDENKKSRSQMEKKDNKIDQMEQKLWEIEEDLKIERQRNFEQKAQDSAVEELNSTIRVKHEELEHMTFLVDEKEVEIAEVRCALQQNELKQSEMAVEFQKNQEKINELESELEYVNESLLEEKKGRTEAEAKIAELREMIKQLEEEMISVNKKMETQNGKSESQKQELTSKTEEFEKELEDMQHKLLEVESELEFTKSSLENVEAEKIDLNTRVEKALKEKELLEEKLQELTTSSESQKNALDQEIDEIRESLLKEKKIVSELEDKLLIAERSRDAAESELRRVLADECASVSKEEMEGRLSAIMNSENELRQELEKEKEKSATLMEQVAELTSESEKWESLAQSKTILLEEETKKWMEEIASFTELRQELEKEKATNQLLEGQVEKTFLEAESKAKALEEEKNKQEEEMAQIVEELKDEKEKLLEQLREISALKVKESEDCYAEKNDRIKELEEKLATASQNITDCEQSIQHYQLKLAKAEYELETTVARLTHLEKQNTTNAMDSTEVENLRKECEAAKKKAQDNLQKYFKESDRLKAIIDEMQDEEEEHLRRIEELEEGRAKKDAELTQLRSDLAQIRETGQNSTHAGDQSEIEALRKECDAVKKKAKDTIDKYLTECNRLKAIVDEQQAIIHKAQDVKKIQEEMEALRIELAQKNMQIQSLQYDLYKLKEKYDNETKSLKNEVECGLEKVGSLKLEIKRLREPETDDTISIMRGQPVASNDKENNEVGVVSNVAIYSLKAKLGKLETETQTLKENVKKLEKEKSTLSLLNTEASNKVAQLCSENNALKTARKKLMEEFQKLKRVQESSKAKDDSVGRLPEVSTEALERQSRNSSVLSELSTCSEAPPAVERKRVKPEPKENFQNWLSGDAANNMFKDEPNQCANQ